MLDKFKFFNSKDKSKTKSSVPKSASKTSNTSTGSTCSSSDRDSRASDRQSSASARSSSSTDPGTCGSSTPSNDSGSPKLPPKTKSVNRSGLGDRKENTLQVESASAKKRTPSPTSVSHSATLPGKKGGTKGDKHEQKGSQDKKASKIGSFIPKSSTKSSKSPVSSSQTSGGGSHIPTPSSSIPKPSSSSSKGSKDKLKSASRDLISPNAQKTNNVPSSSSQTSSLSSPSRSMQYHPSAHQGSSTLPSQTSQLKHGSHNRETAADQSKLTSQDHHSRTLDDRMHHQSKARYTEVEYSDGRIERVGEGHYNKPNHLSLSQLKLTKQQNQQANSATSQVRNVANPQAPHAQSMMSPSQTINIVKPTCSVAAPSNVLTKADGNTQTNLSVLSRAIPPPLPKTEPPPRSVPRDHSNQSIGASSNKSSTNVSEHNSDSHSSSSNSGPSGHSNSSSESVIFKPSSGDEYSGSEKGGSSNTSSPSLNVKGIHPNLQKPANNVAIVQPRHGEKVETTFDTEVRTEKVNKDGSDSGKTGKETTFTEKGTTFVDDSGEKMDIKPMAPIMRAMPYGSSGLLRGYGSPGNKILNYHNPGYATPTAAYFASTSRLGINRPLLDHGKFYSGPIRKMPSSGPNSSLDTDYNSDYDTLDYISGYMSDGDILKTNNAGKMDDMGSGYLSEGGASLYARRLQQRFREGMQAVKECMQKSSGLIDDDR